VTPLLHLSPLGLLDVWDDLLTARYGDNGFGGDTAEIYAFRCVGPGAVMMLAAARPDSGMARDAALEAAQGLHAILELFTTRHRVIVEVDGCIFGPWVATTPFYHRAAVRVTPVEARP
jgi:hypothetical protein